MPQRSRTANHRKLLEKVEEVVGALDRGDTVIATIHAALDHVIAAFHEELGIDGGRLYERERDDYVLRGTVGAAKPAPADLRIPRDYPPIDRVLERGVVFMRADDPLADATFEQALGVEEFAAIELGDRQFLLAFDVPAGSHRGDVLASLGIVRHGLNERIHRQRMDDLLQQVRQIQASILPRRPPVFPPFDFAGCSTPMTGELVGGDLLDYIPITDKILGLAVADVTGHGLPAALQVRDIYAGLRMGLARDFKIVRTIERLNRIIFESTLTSRFVSMFYGELERNGTFIYVNAGHPPPLHVAGDGRVTLLDQGGPVLGPLPDATYDRGFIDLRAGDLLVLFTDGIIEADGVDGSGEYRPRLTEVARQLRGRPAQEVVDAILEDLAAWTGNAPAEDDYTVMAVTRLEAP